MQKALDDDAKRGFLLLLDGDCTYEEKARFAEKVGAQALIIFEQQTKTVIKERKDHHYAGIRVDGSGASVSIPTLVIDHKDGSKLYQMVRDNDGYPESQVVLQAEIEVSTDDSQSISYSLYYGSIVDLDYGLIAKLYNY